MDKAATGPLRYWIFQGVPEIYDLKERLRVNQVEPWLVTQYREEIRKGDIVHFWRAGGDDAIYGWGVVTGERPEPFAPMAKAQTQASLEPAEYRVEVTYRERLSAPISRSGLLEDSRFAALTILRSPAGTNFRITSLEARALNQLIEASGNVPPPGPETKPGMFPPTAFKDYRYSNSPGRAIDRAGELTLLSSRFKKRVEPAALFWAVIETAMSEEKNPRGTHVFLEKLFAEQGVDAVALLRAHFITAKTRQPDFSSPPSPIDAAAVQVPERTLNACAWARIFAIATTGSERIRLRHLFAGLLFAGKDAKAGIKQVLDKLGFDAPVLLDRFCTFAREQFRDKRGEAWTRLPEMFAEQATKAKDTEFTAAEELEGTPAHEALDEKRTREVTVIRELLAPFIPDLAEGVDFIGIAGEVEAFAKLIAGRHTDLPMAIGLFGHWGQGKTFFIRHLQERIDLHAEAARDAATDKRPTNDCRNIVQIELNAWHYMEADIWASFADHIFRELAKYVLDQEKGEDLLENLLNDLEDLGTTDVDGKERLEEVNQTIQVCEKQQTMLEQQQELAQAELGGMLDSIAGMEKNPELAKKIKDAFSLAAREFRLPVLERIAEAIDGASDTLADLHNLGKRAQKQAESLGGFLRRLGKTKIPGWAYLAFGVSLAAGIAIWLVPGMGAGPGLGGALTTLIGWIGSATKWLDNQNKGLNGVLDAVDQVEDQLEVHRVQALDGSEDPALEKVKGLLAMLEKERDLLIEQQRKATNRAASLRARIEGRAEARSAAEFIARRAAGDDYRKKLGTLALVRRDFQNLSELLTSESDEAFGKIDRNVDFGKIDRNVDFGKIDRNVDFGKIDRNVDFPKIDRIVLYIDDLDRCKRERVMKVLEAVHLLMAHKLFAVVLAVDARWVRSSVEAHIHSVLTGDQAQYQDGDGRPDTQEYLEKVIQIPYWLEGLTDESTARLIRGVIGDENIIHDSSGESSDDMREGDAPPDEIIEGAAPPENAPKDDREGDSLAAGTGQNSRPENTALPSDTGAPLESSASETRPMDRDQLPSEGAEVPKLTPQEVEFMEALSPIIQKTPRAVKRFINLYWLVRAFYTETQRMSFLQDEGEFRPVMLLLAVLTGKPKVARFFFRKLEEIEDADELSELAARLQEEDQKDESGSSHEWEWLVRALNELAENQRAIISVHTMREWLGRIGRFGYEEIRSTTPGQG